jgi:hypothetical protein
MLRVLATLVKNIRTAVVVSKPISAKISSTSSFRLRSIRTCNFTEFAFMRDILADLGAVAIQLSAPLAPFVPSCPQNPRHYNPRRNMRIFPSNLPAPYFLPKISAGL